MDINADTEVANVPEVLAVSCGEMDQDRTANTQWPGSVWQVTCVLDLKRVKDCNESKRKIEDCRDKRTHTSIVTNKLERNR